MNLQTMQAPATAALIQSLYNRLMAICALMMILTAPAMAFQELKSPMPDITRLPTRELRVPIEDLKVLLSAPNERVVLTRGEYEKLLREAKLTPKDIALATTSTQIDANSPVTVEPLQAAHNILMQTGRAIIESEYKIEIFKEGWFELPLEMSQVQILSATLDDNVAWLKPTSDNLGTALVFHGKGVHQLKLRWVTPISETSAQQSLSVVLPASATTHWNLSVPGNVEILAGAGVLSREVDSETNSTSFRLIPNVNPEKPQSASLNLTMTLNNKLAKEQSLADVRSQQLIQRSVSAENIVALFDLRVLQGSEPKFVVEIPDGFEIQSVQSPWMSKWGIDNPDAADLQSSKRLTVVFREAVTDRATIQVQATRTAGLEKWKSSPWRLPSWKTIDVARHDALVAVYLSEELRWKDVQAQQAIAIAPARFQEQLKQANWQSSDPIRAVFAAYCPGAEHSLQATLETVKKSPKLDAAWLATIGERDVQLLGRLTVSATQESLDRVSVRVPDLWRLQQVNEFGGQTLAWEKQANEGDAIAGVTTYVIRLPRLLKLNQSIQLQANWAATPDGWLGSWETNTFSFPKIGVVDFDVTSTILSAAPQGDLSLEETDVAGLDPLLMSERALLAVANSSADSLAYVTSQADWRLAIQVAKKKSTLIAESLTYVNASTDGLRVQHEISVTPERASIDELRIQLPERTPTEVAIRTVVGSPQYDAASNASNGAANDIAATSVSVKSFSQVTADGVRVWSVKLQERTLKPVRLLIEYRLPSSTNELQIPIPKLMGASYQSGLVAVDRDDAMEVSIRTSLRRADVGELTDSKISIGANFLGVFGYAAFEDIEPGVYVKALTRELSYIPPTLAQWLQIESWVSDQGWSYHQANYTIRTATGKVAVLFPEELELWSVTVDGKPTLPQRDGDLAIIELPEDGNAWQAGRSAAEKSATLAASRSLVMTYAFPIQKLGLSGSVRLTYPQLVHQSAEGRVRLPLADMKWRIHSPHGFELTAVQDGIADWNESDRRFPWNVPGTLLGAIKSTLSAIEPLEKSVAPSTKADFMPPPSSALSSQAPPSKREEEKMGQEFDSPLVVAPPAPANAQEFAPKAALPSKPGDASRQIRQRNDVRRSLALAVDTLDSWQTRELAGLDAESIVDVQFEQQSRWIWLAGAVVSWLVAMYFLLWSLPRSRLFQVSICIAAVALIAPLLLDQSKAIATICESAFWAVVIMLSFRCLFATWHLLTQKTVTRIGTAALFALVLLTLSSSSASAQEVVEAKTLEQMLQLLRNSSSNAGAIKIPVDAIVVPYSPTDRLKVDAEKEELLIPLSTFEYLQELIQKSNKEPSTNGNTPLGSGVSLGVMEYRVQLDVSPTINLIGTVSILNPTNDVKQIPLALSGAVLVDAILDDVPATLFAAGENLVLNVPPSGKPQTLKLTIQTKTNSQAGWQGVQAIIPSTSATRLIARVSAKETDVRLANKLDRGQFTTDSDNQEIETGLYKGELSLQWRPKISQVVTDQSLQADIVSTVVLLENRVQASSAIQFTFRRGRRDEFLITAPSGYRIEKVLGDNVKGWKVEESEQSQQILVSLLKTAVENEQLQVIASKQINLRGISPTETQALELPVWKIPDAQVARGQLHLFAVNDLTASVREQQGLTREDINFATVKLDHPTPIQAFAAYRFARNDYSAKIIVKPVASIFDSNLNTNLFVSRGELTIDHEITVAVVEGELSQIRLQLPALWQWELSSQRSSNVEPLVGQSASQPTNNMSNIANNRPATRVVPSTSNDILEMELKPESDGKVEAIVRSATPITKSLRFTIRGKQKRDSSLPVAGSQIPLPSTRVLGAKTDRGNILVWGDRGISADIVDLQKVTRVSKSRGAMHPLLASMEQKLVLQYILQNPSDLETYSANLNWLALKPIIEVVSVCNAKQTKQSIEQTVYVEWLIREAGISQLSFVLPAVMKNAKISAPLTRKIVRQPLNAANDSPIRVTIELQDQILGEYRVLVQNDLPWSNEKSAVPLVSGLTGNVRHQFVTLENSGFDELTVDSPVGMQPLVGGDSYWNEFAKILGNSRVQAFRIDDAYNTSEPFAANAPKLSFSTQTRAAVETVNAKIGLAVTQLSVDAQGNYRGSVEYRMENFSEPYLEIEIPAGSQLWSVSVADTAVKPGNSDSIQSTPKAQRFRLPLVRTQLGDLDYGVRLIYAGRLPKLGIWSSLELPLVKSINVQPDQSQLRLFLPPSMKWYGWDGTLGKVESEDDITASWFSFRNKQIQGLSNLLSQKSADEFSQLRASENFKRLSDQLQVDAQSQSGKAKNNYRLAEELNYNSVIIKEAKKQQEMVELNNSFQTNDNRMALGNRFSEQAIQRANGNFKLEQAQSARSYQAPPVQSTVDQLFANQAPPQQPGFLPTPPATNGPAGQLQDLPQTPEVQMMQPPISQAQSAPVNQDRQQSDAKQMAQRYKNKIQNDSKNVEGLQLSRSNAWQANDFSKNDLSMNGLGNDKSKLGIQSNKELSQAPPTGEGGSRGMNGLDGSPTMPRPGMPGRASDPSARSSQLGGMGGGYGGMGDSNGRAELGDRRNAGGPGGFGGGRGGSVQSGGMGSGGQGGGDFGGTDNSGLQGNQDLFGNNVVGLPEDLSARLSLGKDSLDSASIKASGLRSVEIQVPMRGTEYLFVTPKGEMRLVAHGFALTKVRNWALALGIVLAAFLLLRRTSIVG